MCKIYVFEDGDFPGRIVMRAFNPMIPTDSKNSSIPANVSNVQDLTNNLGGAAFLPSSDITNLQDDVTTLQNQAKGIILSVPEANWSTSGSGYVNTLTVSFYNIYFFRSQKDLKLQLFLALFFRVQKIFLTMFHKY